MKPSVQQVIDLILDDIPPAIPRPDWPKTVDGFLSGDPTQIVTGVVTTHLATQAVVERAAARGANLIISHEGIFYAHSEPADWLAGDPVRAAKQQLIDESGLVVYRFHDGWHRREPDGIVVGLIEQLGWESYVEPYRQLLSRSCTLPAETTVRALAEELKLRLGIGTLRIIGDPAMPCRRVGLSVGFAGSELHLRLINETGIEVIICGEAHEWEACEYVRDAAAQGRRLAMVVLGHAHCEEPGMVFLAKWLRQRLPDVPIANEPAGELFIYI